MTLKEYFKVSVPSIGMYRGVTFYYRTAEVDGIKLVIPDSVETEVFIEYGGREYKLVFRDMAQTIPKELEEYDGRIWQVRFITKRKKYVFTSEQELDNAIDTGDDSLRLYAASQYSELYCYNLNMGPLLDVAVFIRDDEYGYGEFFDNFIRVTLETHREFIKRQGL